MSVKNLFKNWKYQAHTFLLIIYFLLYEIFRSQKLKSDLGLDTVLIFLAGTAIFFSLSQKVLSYVTKSSINASILASILFAITFFFPTWVDILLDNTVFSSILSSFDIHKKIIIFLSLLVLYAIIVILVIRMKSDLKQLSIYVTMLLASFIIMECANFATFRPNNVRLENDLNVTSPKLNQYPDIYYIILDHYSSNNSLKNYDHDNKYFTNFLKNQGFYVATDSRSNYNYTSSSLSSSLNSSYLNINHRARYSVDDAATLAGFIRDSKVSKILDNYGYSQNIYGIYGIQLHPAQDMTRPGDKAGKSKSLMSTLLRAAFQRFDVSEQQLLHKAFYKYNINSFRFLDSLAATSEADGPRFNFIHTLTAHTPFVVDSSGNFQSDVNQTHSKESYIREIKYTNKRIMAFLRSLNSKPNYKPIIIIQSDHGSHLNDLQETSTILNAYYFPDRDYSALYPKISPVNTFRVIFNKYFDAKLPLLPDRNFYVFYP